MTSTDVDYNATSLRPAWSTLPQPVRTEVGALAGSRVLSADPAVTSGFTGSYAGTVTTSTGRRVFVKGGNPAQPFVIAALTQEARVLAELPDGIPAPDLVGFGSVDGWSVLVLEVVPGRMPGQPWTAAEVDAVHRACLAVAEAGTPTTIGLRDLGRRMSADADIVDVARALADGSFAPSADLPPWLPQHQGRVADLVLGAPGRFNGETLCHGDLRPDNLLVDSSAQVVRATVVDWNWVGNGAKWLDWVGLLPLMWFQGFDTEPLVRSSPLTPDADPEAIDAYLACIAAYMMGGFRQPPPPGCTPALRRHQLLMASVFLEFLRWRRGWTA